MIYRNSVVSPNGFLYNVVLDEPAANATFLHAHEGVIGIKNGAISYVYGPDTTANSNYSWLSGLGYGSVSASDLKTVAFSCTGGTVVATIGGVATTSPIKARVGTTIVFTITPDVGYSYSGTNPETLVVSADVTKSFVCEEIPYLKFTSTGASTVSMGLVAAVDYDNPEVNDMGWDVQYSLDNGASWTTLPSWFGTQPVISLADGESVKFRGTMTSSFFLAGSVGFVAAGSLVVSGDMTTLLNNGVGGVLDLTSYPINCFSNKFRNCAITSAADLVLPSTTLRSGCYSNMFNGCTSLTSAPDLPATTLAYDCYIGMFGGCTNLKGTVNISAASPYYEGTSSACGSMFFNAGTAEGAGGTINVGGSDAATWASAAGIDIAHWTIVPPVPYLTFTSTGATVISTAWPSSNDDEAHVSESNDGWEYSYDKSTWNAMTWYQTQVPLTDGQSVYFRGTEKTGGHSGFTVSGDGTVAVSGDVTVMLNNVGGVLDLTSYGSDALSKLFSNCSKITSANLVLPSTTLTQLCYSEMFYGCTRLAGTITIAASAPGQSCLMMFVDASTVAGAGGTINVGGSTAEEWASAAEIDTTKWTITVINEELPKKEEPIEDYPEKKEDPVDEPVKEEPVKEEPVDEVIPEKVPDAEATE